MRERALDNSWLIACRTVGYLMLGCLAGGLSPRRGIASNQGDRLAAHWKEFNSICPAVLRPSTY